MLAQTGALAGGGAAVLTTPLDVVRTRHVLRQAAHVDGAGTLIHQRVSFLNTAWHIYASEGWRAFLRGIGPRTTYMSMGGVFYLGTYSLCSSTLSKAWAVQEHQQ